MTWIAGFILVFWLHALVSLIIGMRNILSLSGLPPLDRAGPTVSVIVAARNEERNIAAAMQSLLEIDYPGLEIIAVNDRSSDATGRILDEYATFDSRLRVLHITELPDDWLGKLHAMQSGADFARGDLLLFADGDVHFEDSALSRAVRYLRDETLDHLCCLPELMNTHWTLRPMIPVFSIFFFLHIRPWRVRDPESSAHIGIGAFNLIRHAAFDAIGGFERIRLRPDDDLKLGKLVKLNGLRQDFVDGRGMLKVEWYHSAGEMVHGLEKNSFAVLDYSPWQAIIAIAAMLLVCLAPFFAGFFSAPIVVGSLLGSVVVASGISVAICHRQELGAHWGLLFPFGAALVIFAMANSAVQALVRRGIRWRGTFYPLELLRGNRI